MSTTLTIEMPVSFQPAGHGGRKTMRAAEPTPPLAPGRMWRKLMSS